MREAKPALLLGMALLTAAGAGCGRTATAPPPEPAPKAEGAAGRSVAAEGTGSVGVVDGDDLHGIPATQLEQLLAGRVAGVQVIRLPGGGISVRIRGPGSIGGDTEPLYVVDGMPVRVTPGRGLDWLNPSDIQRIEILKDAVTTSMYGVQGANGVVLITTRRRDSS
ncbi:MAG: TonB-dependent receptor plug domain-containing protein [Longimicrobiales bacterium]